METVEGAVGDIEQPGSGEEQGQSAGRKHEVEGTGEAEGPENSDGRSIERKQVPPANRGEQRQAQGCCVGEMADGGRISFHCRREGLGSGQRGGLRQRNGLRCEGHVLILWEVAMRSP